MLMCNKMHTVKIDCNTTGNKKKTRPESKRKRCFSIKMMLVFKYLYLLKKIQSLIKTLWDSLCLQLVNVKSKLLYRKYKDNYYDKLNIYIIY